MRPFRSLYAHGFVRAAACAPRIAPADPAANAAETLALARKAHERRAALALFPELGLSGYAIDDLLMQDALLSGVLDALEKLVEASAELFPTLIVGAPLKLDGAVYNCGVVIHRGEILGVVPKSFLPNYREFYEKRYFAAASHATRESITLFGEEIPFGADLVFEAADYPGYALGVEICEDVWAPTPPSTDQALAGATVLANLSASNIVIGKAEDRNILCDAQSRRCVAAYLYSAAGYGESTTDLAWDGHLAVFEAGAKLAESERFATESVMIEADIDVGRLVQERVRLGTFRDAAQTRRGDIALARRIPFRLDPPEEEVRLSRKIDRFPFVPDDPERLDRDCFEAYNIQVSGLMTRMQSSRVKKAVIGVSGGLDSTQALLVICRAFDLMGRSRKDILAVTMPGFATGEASKNLADELMAQLGVDAREIDVKPLSMELLRAIGHPYARGEKVYDVTFENVQAGARTDLLFRLANQEGGLVVGTSDLSELALGWCTYGVGDHMSHYAVNASVSKTLIQHLIRWVAARDLFGAGASTVLRQVLAAEISPELVPAEAGAVQSTQAIIGPYPLQDFSLFYLTRYGLAPSKIAFLALEAWEDAARGAWPPHIEEGDKRAFTLAEIKRWMEVFLTRFFAQSQFKRSAIPNGPKISSGGALSPRGDWRAPSDSSAAPWLDELRRNVP
ncbi:MAG: NAD(+) synthase [Hyphomonadaceae bacterium]